MSTRRERVVLTLDDKGFTSGMAKAAASAEALDAALDDLDGGLGDLDHQTQVTTESNRELGDSFETTGNKAQKASKGIDAFSGRLSLMASAAVALGPALIPGVTSAAAAVGSLSVAVTGLAGALGTTALAFAGVGDAMDALDAYQLDPSQANLEELNRQMKELGKTGEEFVRFLDSELEPAVDQLQKTARNNMFPQLEDALTEMLTVLPQVTAYVGDMATAVGDLAAEAAGEIINSSDWQAFFNYLATEGIPIFTQFTEAMGNFAAGAANTITAMAPMTEAFTQNLYDMSRAFRQWSAQLSSSSGFQDFMDYAMRMGPEFAEMLGSLAQLAYSVAEAFAPWSELIVPAITAVSDALSALLSTPLGSWLATATASIMLFNKSMAAFSTIGRKASASMAALGVASKESAVGTEAAAASAARGSSSVSKLGVAARTAAGPAGLMLLTTEAAHSDDALGSLTRTASAAAIGFGVGGPWGAAIGAAVGGLRQFSRAEREAAEAADQLTVTLDEQTGGFDKATESQLHNQMAQEGLYDTADKLGVSYKELNAAAEGNAVAQTEVNNAIARGIEQDKISKAEGDKLRETIDANSKALNEKAIHADQAAVADGELTKKEAELRAAYRESASDISYQTSSLKGNTQGALQNRSAVDGMIVSLERYAIQEAKAGASNQQLSKFIKQGENDLVSQATQMGLNEKEVRQYVDALNLTPAKIRTAVILQGAGMADEQISALNKQYEKLPPEVKTIIKQLGAKQTADLVLRLRKQYNSLPVEVQTYLQAIGGDIARHETKELKRDYNALPKKVRTKIEEFGAAAAQGNTKKLQHQYDLTPKQVDTIIKLFDEASPKIKAVQRELKQTDGQHADTKTTNDNHQATSSISHASSELRGLDGDKADTDIYAEDHASSVIDSITFGLAGIPRTVTTVVKTVHQGAEGGLLLGARQYDSGGLDRPNGHQPELARAPMYRVWAEPETKGEAYIPLANDHRRPRAKSILEQTAALLGGAVTWNANGNATPPASTPSELPPGRNITYAATINTAFASTLDTGFNQLATRLERVEKAIRDKAIVDDRSRAKHSDRNAQLTGASIGGAATAGKRAQRYGG